MFHEINIFPLKFIKSLMKWAKNEDFVIFYLSLPIKNTC